MAGDSSMRLGSGRDRGGKAGSNRIGPSLSELSMATSKVGDTDQGARARRFEDS
jgi:hypothetical protein